MRYHFPFLSVTIWNRKYHDKYEVNNFEFKNTHAQCTYIYLKSALCMQCAPTQRVKKYQIYCKTGFFRGHVIFTVERFCRIADFNFRGSIPSLYSKLLKKLGFSNFAEFYFRGLGVNSEKRENNMSAEKNSSTVL